MFSKDKNRFRIPFRRIIAFSLVAGILTFPPIPTAADDYAGEIQDAQNAYDSLSGQKGAIAQLIEEKQQELSRLSAEIAQAETDRLSQLTQKDKTLLELTFLRDSITQFDADIAEMQAECDELERLFLDRAKIMYQNSKTDYLTLFFESDSIFDFLYKLQAYNQMMQEDRALLKNLKNAKQQLAVKKQQQEELFSNKEELLAEIEDAISDLENNRSLIEDNYSALSVLLSRMNEEENAIDAQMDELAEKINALEAAQKEAEERARKAAEEAAKAAAAEKKRKEEEARKAAEEAERARQEAEKAKQEAENQGTVSRGDSDKNFCWPIETYSYISSPFGYRTHPINGSWSLHSGVDLAAPRGTKIYAAQSGIVKIAHTKDDNAFGLHIQIEHEPGLETKYAHCSKLLVSEGDYVTRGQVIAEVGMTGSATGNHLHFEVIIDGKPVQPLDYISEP